MKERGELPTEEVDVAGEYKAMHEENFWSSWTVREVKEKGWQKPRRRRRNGCKEEKRRGERRERNGDCQKKM